MLQKAQQIKNDISYAIEKYIIDDNVRRIRIHFLILCYNQVDAISSFINPVFTILNENRRKKFIRDIFTDKKFLDNSKITYKDVELLIAVNPIGFTENGAAATFVTDSSDYKRIVKYEDLPLKDDGFNTPRGTDVRDAVILCLDTYDSQRPIDQSIPDFVYDVVNKAFNSVKNVSASVLSNLFSKKNLDTLLEGTQLNFDTKESSKMSFNTITNMIPDVLNDLSFFDTLFNIGLVVTGTPSAYSGALGKVLKSVPEVGRRCLEISSNTVEGIKYDVLSNLTFDMIEKEVEKHEKAQKIKSGIRIFHKNDKSGYGLCEDGVNYDDCEISVYDVVSDSELEVLLGYKKNLMISQSSGFYSKLYKKRGEEKYFFCTAGTNMLSAKDWINNISQGLIGLSSQYTTSVIIAKTLDKSLKGKKLIFAGHSLGGGLASNNSLVTTSRHAITFNAAGLGFLRTKVTLFLNNKQDLYYVKRRESKIHAYVLEGELLNSMLSKIGEEANGHRYIIKTEGTVLDQLSAKDKHKLENFLNLKCNDELSIQNTL